MRAVALTADATLEVVDVAEPEATGDSVVVAVERCGICGSDLHLKDMGVLPVGTVMGHEFAGTVASIGPEVQGVTVGERVAVYPSAPCRRCASCLAGRHSICLHQAPTAIGLGSVPGGYAEYALARAASCFALPEATSAELGALTEPYAVGLHAVRRSAVAPGTAVGIIGAGPIGLMTLAALRAEGVEDVVVAERSDTRAAVAEALGATTVVDDATRIDVALGGQPDVVFECAGVGATPPLAVQLVRPGGKVVLVGVAGFDDPISLVGALLVIKEVDLVSCLGYTLEEFGEAVATLATGALDPAAVVSAVVPLEEAEVAFADLRRPGGPVKVMLSPVL